jgi:hypothetical protein
MRFGAGSWLEPSKYSFGPVFAHMAADHSSAVVWWYIFVSKQDPILTNSSSQMPILLQKVAGPDWLKRIGYLRSLVWKNEGVRVPDLESTGSELLLDELDVHAHHWVALHGRRLIASGRFSIHPDDSTLPDAEWFHNRINIKFPVASFNRLVVLKPYRSLGIGKRLDILRSWDAIQLGCAGIVAVAVGDHRRDALSAIGFDLSFQFDAGHGLLVPERPLYALTADAEKLRKCLPQVQTTLSFPDSVSTGERLIQTQSV